MHMCKCFGTSGDTSDRELTTVPADLIPCKR
jgi:hypothetical protein